MEIVGHNFLCNLSEVHLNQINPFDFATQEKAFKAGALTVAALLWHKFQYPKFQESRELDPIVASSFTGLFDFFVTAFGADWLLWWMSDRNPNWGKTISITDLKAQFNHLFEALNPSIDNVTLSQGNAFKLIESLYLQYWNKIVNDQISEYCDKHGLKKPNRVTAVQPAGSKSLLTGASSGWHPPKAQRYIRRITFAAHHPVALAAMDYGYSVVPSQSCVDEDGRLLDDPFDERVTEWLIEIPVAVPWADMTGVDQIDVSQFSIKSQFDFFMTVQQNWTEHATSATLEYRENEIEELAKLMYEAIENDEGYISAAVMARFDNLETFPRLPFEPISKEKYEEMVSKVTERRSQESQSFYDLVCLYDRGWQLEEGASGCDSDKCLIGDMPKVEKSKTVSFEKV